MLINTTKNTYQVNFVVLVCVEQIWSSPSFLVKFRFLVETDDKLGVIWMLYIKCLKLHHLTFHNV